MAITFRSDIKFKSSPEEPVEEYTLDGGLVADVHETKLRTNQSPNNNDIVYTDTGTVKTRNGYSRYNTDPVGAASDTANTGASTGILLADATSDYIAQTFQASGAISVVQVDLYLEMQDSGDEQLAQVELWSTSGGEPDAVLTNGQSQVLLVSGTSETTYNFRFKEPVSLSASTTYAIVFHTYSKGNATTVNEVEVNHTGNDYATYQVYTSTDTGSSWSGDSAKDLRFVVYGGGDTGGTGLIRYYGPSTTQQLIAKIGTSLYRGNDVSGAMTAITLGSGASLTAGNYIDWTIWEDTLLVADGTNEIQKYRGSTNANYSTGTISVTNGDATVTGSGTSWSTSTNAEVGEYIQMPDTKWYKIASIASDTSLEIEISYQGTTLSGQSYTISPWGEIQGKLNSSTAPSGLVVPTPSYVETHINRVWTLEGNTARFSALSTSVTEEMFNDWDTAENAGTILVPDGNGDTGTGLYSLNNTLYIFQRNAIWRVYGSSPATFELRNVTHEVGLVDRKTLVEYNDVLFFLSDNGVMAFDGSNLKNISEDVVGTLVDAWANKTSVVGALWGNNYILSYTPSGETYNSESLFYDIEGRRWGKLTNVFASGWSNWNGGTDSDEVYFISSNQGSIYQWDTGSNDDGYEIPSLYDTPSLHFGINAADKMFKKFYIQQLSLGNHDMTATMYTDIDSNTQTSTIDLNPGTDSLWDTMNWDDDNWAAEGSILTNRAGEFQGEGKYFKFRFEQSGYDEGMEVLGFTATSKVRRLR